MDSQDALSQATSIVRDALAGARRTDYEQTVREAELSSVPVLQSLARAYRMLQRPFQ